MSSSDLEARSWTVWIPALFKQLYERTDKSNSSIVISNTLFVVSLWVSDITSIFIAISVNSTNIFKCSTKIFAANEIASNGFSEPLVSTSNTNWSYLALSPTRVGSTE